jgi:hypothetical protein
MHACALERERVEACCFMVATAGEPLSMCLHNAERDVHLLRPSLLGTGDQARFWDPVTGRTAAQPMALAPIRLTRRNARGRARAAFGP